LKRALRWFGLELRFLEQGQNQTFTLKEASMKLTPLDIKKQEFKKVLRGYDPVEVDSFLDMMSNEFADLLRQSKEMSAQLVEFETQLRDYRQMEKTLQQTLMQAQEASGRSIENSRKEGQLIIQEAELKANQLLDRARMDLSRTREEIANLRSKKESIVSRLKVLLNSEIDLIKALEVDDDELTKDLSRGTGKESIEIDEIIKKL
jgi:cell division initiation protein